MAATARTSSCCRVVRRNGSPGMSSGLRPTGSRTGRRSGMPVRAHDASEYLQTPADVAAYLNAAMEESDGDPRLLMKAFRNVAASQGGVSALARRADINREALSRGLSGDRDPRLGTVARIAAACGVKLQFVQRPPAG
ncbi:MAG: putative addiction module antidote protein [Acidobacteria bacterium]|nr:putative addiction module antidote protein [Acidobacteriota bacterium]MYH31263.1 putative addiction module antidote protein [Acidobacteriota bacterium]